MEICLTHRLKKKIKEMSIFGPIENRSIDSASWTHEDNIDYLKEVAKMIKHNKSMEDSIT